MMDELREFSKCTGHEMVFITAAGEDWDAPQDAILEGRMEGRYSLRIRTRAFRDRLLLVTSIQGGFIERCSPNCIGPYPHLMTR